MRSQIIALTAILSACPGGKPVDNNTTPEAPSNLVYSTSPFVYTVGVKAEPDFPSWDGGKPTSYAVTPTLPPGITLNATDGSVGGTPNDVSAKTKYTVTASNDVGSTTGTFELTVNAAPVKPAGLHYQDADVTYVIGMAVTNNATLDSGTPPITYTVSPALPAGLSIDANTGKISGTPTGTANPVKVTYTVKAANAQGETSASIKIATSATLLKPDYTGYQNVASYFVNVAIANNAPINGGAGPATSFTFNPATPPPGLSFDTTTGVISGTPAATFGPTDFTITARNAAGDDTTPITLSIHVTEAGGLSVTYPAAVSYCTPGTTIAAYAPAVSGVLTNIDVPGATAAGLTVNHSTGEITGNPTATSDTGPWVFTATNGATTVTGDVNITLDGTVATPEVFTFTLSGGGTSGPNGPTTSANIARLGWVSWQFTGTDTFNWDHSVVVDGGEIALVENATVNYCFNGAGNHPWSLVHVTAGLGTIASGTIRVAP